MQFVPLQCKLHARGAPRAIALRHAVFAEHFQEDPMPQINLRVDEEIERRLQYLSARTGRSKTFYATEALTQYLDENEDYLLAKDALEEFAQSNDDAVDLDDVIWPA